MGSQQPSHRETDRPVPRRGSVRFCSMSDFALFFVWQSVVNRMLSLKDDKQLNLNYEILKMPPK